MSPIRCGLFATLAVYSIVSGTASSDTLEVPPDINSGSTTSTSVSLTWDATPSRRGKTTYTIFYCDASTETACDPSIVGKVTKRTSGTIDGLVTDTPYLFKAYAQDAAGNDATGETFGPLTPAGDGDGGDGGGSGEDACNYPVFSDPPGPAYRDFLSPAYRQEANLVFADEFDGVTSEAWIIENMVDPLNKSGNADIDAEGEQCNNCRPEGKRHSAWYDERLSENISGFDSADKNFITEPGLIGVEGLHDQSGALSLGGSVQEAKDPTRPGAGIWNSRRLSTAWLKTWARKLDYSGESDLNQWGRDAWTAPMYLEARVNFDLMNTPGFRLSIWLMPATYPSGELATGREAYDGNFANGFEIDIFEYEPWKSAPECRQLLEFSWINSFGGKGRRARLANGKTHYNGADDDKGLIGGWHTVGLLWEENRIQWMFDDKVVLEIDDASMIPTVNQYLNVSREMTNGFVDGAKSYDGGGYFLPPESGLYGFEGGSNIGDHFDNIPDDKALIDYIRIYKP